MRLKLLLLLLPISIGHAAASELETVEVQRVERASEFRLDGRIEAVNKATVSAQTSGRIVELPYDVDDYVPAGAVIVRFRDTEQQARLKQAQASLEEAVARNDQAQKELQRISGLVDEGLVSQSAFDSATAEAEAASARLEAARAAVNSAEEQLEYTRVRAPYAGIVTARHVQQGELAQPGQPLMSGLSLESLRVVVDVPQALIERVREGAELTVISPEGERITAEDISIFPFADEATHSFRLRADLPLADLEGDVQLFPGMLVKAVFATGTRDVLVLPSAAIARRGEVTAVYVRAKDEFRFRQVRIGRSIDGMTEILSGLETGARVALDPTAAARQYKDTTATGGNDE